MAREIWNNSKWASSVKRQRWCIIMKGHYKPIFILNWKPFMSKNVKNTKLIFNQPDFIYFLFKTNKFYTKFLTWILHLVIALNFTKTSFKRMNNKKTCYLNHRSTNRPISWTPSKLPTVVLFSHLLSSSFLPFAERKLPVQTSRFIYEFLISAGAFLSWRILLYAYFCLNLSITQEFFFRHGGKYSIF